MKIGRAFVVLCFVILLAAGWLLHRDYGVGWDELAQRDIGLTAYAYVAGSDDRMLRSEERDHGVSFELALIGLEKAFEATDPRDMLRLRHFANFLAFYAGVAFFYLLCFERTGVRWLALLGATFLVLSPRIFAHAFYNSKDIPFLSLMIAALYAAALFLQRATFLRIVFLSVTTALAISIRLLGVIVPLIVTLFVVLEVVGSEIPRERFGRRAAELCVYLALSVPLTILLWPYLWSSPFDHFLEAFLRLGRYPYDGIVLFDGELLRIDELPWSYIPTWMALTIPLLYSGLFAVGSVAALTRLYRARGRLYRNASERLDLLCLAFLLGPLVAVIAMGSVLYDGWRHLYFCYPALLLIAVSGLEWLLAAAGRSAGRSGVAARAVIAAAVAVGVIQIARFQVRSHPHQFAYFNSLAGDGVSARYEQDYWGLSYRPALEFLLDREDGGVVKLAGSSRPVRMNALILPPSERARLRFVAPSEADYFIFHSRYLTVRNYRTVRELERSLAGNDIFSVRVDREELISVRELKRIPTAITTP